MHRLFAVFLLAMLSPVVQSRPPQPQVDGRPYALMVGDPAPGLEVEWFKPGPAYKIEKGRPYVVEFWATWCAPCVRNIPHLTELQAKYQGKVTIVGVSVWEPRPHEVGAFVDGQGPKMGYSVAMDSVPPAPADVENPSDWAKVNGKASKAWLRASGWDWNGIPVAFVVDQNGRIAWVGNPNALDEPLDAVVHGRWDIEAFKPRYRAEREAVVKARPLYTQRRAALQAKDYDTYLKTSDELFALHPALAVYAAGTYRVLLVELKDVARANRLARDIIDRLGKDDRDSLNEMAGVIVDVNGDLNLALAASLRAEEISNGKDVDTLVMLADVRAARREFQQAADAMARAAGVARKDQRDDLEKKREGYRNKAGR